ncbi:unnamed protein product [Cuscuta epithymum]|uniref:Uncharacterized protein n=1 Tax=Cuscuta epithymum TaxID=186058 RepID=A0AAV0GAU6_9ASTE|nr:unnamed protein product [Cuscuta epithymum]
MSSPSKSHFHPALAVTNIKNLIPITLDSEHAQYSTWSELFKITARAYQVIDHILPPSVDTPSAASSSTSDSSASADDPALWTRLDANVLQWIYGSISNDLLHTIIQPNSTAKAAWDRLTDIFLDNKHTRAIHLENQFSNTRLDQFSSIDAYCRTLKTLSDDLANVGAPVDNRRLVLRLVNGLNGQFESVASFIQQQVPLPSFFTARSMLTLDESRRAQHVDTPTTALVATPAAPTASTVTPAPSYSSRPRGGGRSGRTRGGGGRGRGRSSNGSSPIPSPPQPWSPGSPLPWFQSPWNPWMSWQMPPCPYPTAPGFSPAPRNPSAGILGPRPQHAHMATPEYSFGSTSLPSAMQTLTLNPPDDGWYMDTGATTHMTSDAGPSNPSSSNAM